MMRAALAFRFFALIAFIVVANFIFLVPVHAQVRGVYPVGMNATNSGVTPEAGITYSNLFIFFSRDEEKGPQWRNSGHRAELDHDGYEQFCLGEQKGDRISWVGQYSRHQLLFPLRTTRSLLISMVPSAAVAGLRIPIINR